MDNCKKDGLKDEFLLVGIDGGATKVSGWSVKTENHGTAFALDNLHATKSYNEIPGYISNFQPVDLNRQIVEWEAGKIIPTIAEVVQSDCYIKAASWCIEQIAKRSGARRVLIGIGMPGIKTEDGRGIAVLKNGPRMCDYAVRLEKEITLAGIELVQPINQIGSDAYYCGIGEEYATEGSFRNVRNSYYLGGGTGAADALKLNGKVIPLDEAKGWFVKTWEMKCPDGFSIEKYVSSSGIQSIYGELIGKSQEELNQIGIFPPQIRQRALEGEEAAIITMQKVAHFLALLFYERITSIYAGWQGLFEFVNPDRPLPQVESNYKNTLFDSLVIGQRLGELLREAQGDEALWLPFVNELTRLIINSSVLDEVAKEHYCPGKRLNPALIRISCLREAPALGAAIDAYLKWKEENYA
ncbi:MAG TPA: hypothetical protein P5268_03030 [Candidatus Marinimicrobia bacterium]|nr:hypothetical protein [Candidatus Neomarinimicrobiota bacterium]HRS52201.1 hypothetical protein [Candidatus Neomarinimicrobiota bacterium]HRU91992.1 hypothetical protein [Candidatus Neomarinimicrobiota bacterium]